MLSTDFTSLPANIDQSYCMFNQQTLKMECMENINLRYVGQDCANPIQIGHFKAIDHDAKCLRTGWGSEDTGIGYVGFGYCEDRLSENFVFCDDGTIRTVANDSYCLTKGDYNVNM